IRCLRGQQGLRGQPSFDGIHIVNHYGGDNESYQSSDEDGVKLLEAGSHYIQTWRTLKARVMRKEMPYDLACPQMAAIRQQQCDHIDR
ncbi:hypothetical protein M9458_013773, partial [Cirrhinus mrigala]